MRLLPVIRAIAAAIKLKDGGPILYRQERTAVFGKTFSIYKFRSMAPTGETATPVTDDDNDRITRVGQLLRQTHLDEIPKLWSILRGDISAVGPRVVWTEEEHLLEDGSRNVAQAVVRQPRLDRVARSQQRQQCGLRRENPL